MLAPASVQLGHGHPVSLPVVTFAQPPVIEHRNRGLAEGGGCGLDSAGQVGAEHRGDPVARAPLPQLPRLHPAPLREPAGHPAAGASLFVVLGRGMGLQIPARWPPANPTNGMPRHTYRRRSMAGTRSWPGCGALTFGWAAAELLAIATLPHGNSCALRAAADRPSACLISAVPAYGPVARRLKSGRTAPEASSATAGISRHLATLAE